ncbi:ABC transporter permease [Dyadobacter frigoris]|uniref:permease prefix domain 2-containing transporter n=1 Tax=Dyadobacter frigoris TaxID=2576211 RepID=UPI0024A30556|nr:permease prefix domain 2-containing transporter [Dyadobacter frigoris]GLU52700.1 ABC transporter permease [Dyadobacter frigoris]
MRKQSNPNEPSYAGSRPPRWADRLLEWFVAPHLLEYIQGDLHEVFYKRVEQVGLIRARRDYGWAALQCLTPFFHKPLRHAPRGTGEPFSKHPQPALTDMLGNYFKIAFRNLAKNKVYSFINISGLAMGMAVTMLIGLWIYDEISFNRYHKNYDTIAQIRRLYTDPNIQKTDGTDAQQLPMGAVLKSNYHQYFKHILMAWWVGEYTLSTEDKKMPKKGEFIEAGALEMLSLKMLRGNYASLNELHSIVLSKSASEAIFGQEDPINKSLKINNRIDVVVTGVYEDIPRNTRFSEVQFFSPWDLWVASNDWIKQNENDWGNSSFSIYVQLQPNVSPETANEGIKDFYQKSTPKDMAERAAKYNYEVFLYPMKDWHLYSEFKNGRPAGGRITFVWLFGIVGLFVLLLACINFMNLSTARSEKRAKEIGVRKAIGSLKNQLVLQFLSESFLVVVLSFVASMLLISIALSWFNQVADKDLSLPFSSLLFWLTSLAFIAVTSFLAGAYPAFYLSSFQPVKVLKGAVHLGRFAALPRKILVVVQFVVSIVLIIGTLVVYKQIQFAQDRPVGYNREGLITIPKNDPNYEGKLDVLRSELLNTGTVAGVELSSSPLTDVWNNMGGFSWAGKDPEVADDFSITDVSYGFGQLVGWQFIAGRDFSKAFATDSTKMIINESAAKYLGLKNPLGEFIKFYDGKKSRQIIGVIKDMVMTSPYEPEKRAFFFLDAKYDAASQIDIKIKPIVSANEALPKIEAIFKKVVPSAAFDYKFVDEEYAKKFSNEKRISKLASFFATLAVFISCLGLFGLASFIAEQRTKEIGVRKVLGASVLNLWGLLSKDFVFLVVIALGIAIPTAWYCLTGWLEKYAYRTEIPWWIFAVSGAGALMITMLTVSFQSIKAALINPVKSLRSE